MQSNLEHYFKIGTSMVCKGREAWMTTEQWQQIRDYAKGRAIPTDHEVLTGIHTAGERRHGSRFDEWAYSNISSAVIGPHNAPAWCKLIRKYGPDPELAVDEGL